MRIAGDRIGGVDAGEMAAQARRDDGGAAPRRVDVKPQVLRPAEAREIRQWIDGAGGRRPGGRDDHQRCTSFAAVLSDMSREIREIHSQIAIRRDDAERRAPEARHVRDFVERMMGFARQIDCG